MRGEAPDYNAVRRERLNELEEEMKKKQADTLEVQSGITSLEEHMKMLDESNFAVVM